MFPRYHDVIAAVPEYERFPTLAELEEATDRLMGAEGVRSWECGRSRAGHPLRCLDVGDGPMHAFLIGLPHPEEPVGAAMIDYLLPLLVSTDLAAELGFSFSVVKVGDPDGVRLNEPWYGRPYDLLGYLLDVFRPAYAEQLEWTFPVSYKRYAFNKPVPEAAALAEAFRRRPIDLVMSLHNAGFCGTYFYLSDDDEELRADLAAAVAAAALPLHRGEPEVPYLTVLDEGVYRAFGLREEYDYLENQGKDPAAALSAGTAADEFAVHLWDCYSLVAETPRFTSLRIADASPAGVSRREAQLLGVEGEEGVVAWLRERYPTAASRMTQDSPWWRTVEEYLARTRTALAAERALIASQSASEAEATQAQLFDSTCLRELAALERVGQFGHMVAAEPRQDETLAALRDEAAAFVCERGARLRAVGGVTPAPIRAAVQVQLAALFSGLVCVRERFRAARPRPAAPRR